MTIHMFRQRLPDLSVILNCHAIGMHSIAMKPQHDGRMVRMFVCESSHHMWKPFAYHAHRRNLRLELVCGEVWHSRIHGPMVEDSNGEFTQYLYRSGVGDGFGAVEDTCRCYSALGMSADKLTTCSLRASDIHSVYVPKGTVAAWVVYEGAEDPSYESVCYSRGIPELPDRLYQKGNVSHIRQLLGLAEAASK